MFHLKIQSCCRPRAGTQGAPARVPGSVAVRVAVSAIVAAAPVVVAPAVLPLVAALVGDVHALVQALESGLRLLRIVVAVALLPIGPGADVAHLGIEPVGLAASIGPIAEAVLDALPDVLILL